MGSCHLQQRWIRVFLPTWTSSLPCLNPHGIWPWIFSGGDSLCLAITGRAHESHYRRCRFLAVMVLYRKEVCVVVPAFHGNLPVFLTSACYLGGPLGWFLQSHCKLKLQRILNIRFSHLKKGVMETQSSQYFVQMMNSFAFSSFYPSDLVLIHLHKTVFLSSCQVI